MATLAIQSPKTDVVAASSPVAQSSPSAALTSVAASVEAKVSANASPKAQPKESKAVLKTFESLNAKMKFTAEQAPVVTDFLNSVRDFYTDDTVAIDVVVEAYEALAEQVDAEQLKSIVGTAKGMAAANLCKDNKDYKEAGDKKAFLKAFCEEQAALDEGTGCQQLFAFFQDPVAYITPAEVPVDESEAGSATSEQSDAAQNLDAPKAGYSTAAKVAIGVTGLALLAGAAYLISQYAIPYFTQQNDQPNQNPNGPFVNVSSQVIDTVVGEVSKVIPNSTPVAETIAETVAPVVEEVAQTVATTVAETVAPATEQIICGLTDPLVCDSSETFLGNLTQVVTDAAAKATELVPPCDPSEAPSVQVVNQAVDATLQQIHQQIVGGTSTTLPPVYESVVQAQTPSTLDNVTNWVSTNAGAAKDWVVTNGSPYAEKVSAFAGNAKDWAVTNGSPYAAKASEFAGTVGQTVKGYAGRALNFAQAKLPESVSAKGYTLDVSATLDAARAAGRGVSDKLAGGIALGTTALATLWGTKKAVGACRTTAPKAPTAPKVPVGPGAAIIGAGLPDRMAMPHIKKLLQDNGLTKAVVDGQWNQIRQTLQDAHLMSKSGKNAGTLAKGNAAAAVAAVKALNLV